MATAAVTAVESESERVPGASRLSEGPKTFLTEEGLPIREALDQLPVLDSGRGTAGHPHSPWTDS